MLSIIKYIVLSRVTIGAVSRPLDECKANYAYSTFTAIGSRGAVCRARERGGCMRRRFSLESAESSSTGRLRRRPTVLVLPARIFYSAAGFRVVFGGIICTFGMERGIDVGKFSKGEVAAGGCHMLLRNGLLCFIYIYVHKL